MAEAVPAVALLFDDAGLGEQLRSALQERGARIVHEGPLRGLSSQLLASVEANVLVVNLDEEDDSALDRLEEALQGERPRVVFNDGQASRKLEGWDRARWARHLAMKVLAVGDADPPRPPAPAEAVADTAPAAPVPIEPPVEQIDSVPAVEEEARQAAVSESLAAELEALLASDAPAEEVNDFGPGLNYAAGEGMALHDGAFQDVVPDATLAEPAATQAPAMPDAPAAPVVEPPQHAVFQIDHLQLAPLGEDTPASIASDSRAESVAPPRVSDNWALLDHDAADAPVVARVDPADFGIEKLSASDYLAPDAGASSDSPIKVGLSLELVSMEEAIAPQHFEPSHAMDLPAGPLPRLVVLGATTESTASVGEFLAALPMDLRATVLHTQHLAGRPADGLVEHFGSQCALPVRLAEPGMRAQLGEVIVVPSDRQVAVRRDGSLDLQPVDEGAAHVPSIDASFTQAAAAFGSDVVAIVFAGRSTDAVGGCQAVHDRGGQVWVEASGGGHAADMVSGVLAEHLSHQAGTPRELATRLAELFAEGQP